MDGLSLIQPLAIREISEITDEPVQCLESLTEFFNVLSDITPAILDGIHSMIRVKKFRSASISLRYEHERSCIDLYKTSRDVVAIIEIVESLREMVDDTKRIERIYVEVRNQIKRGKSNLDGKNVTCFPELNDFLTELLMSVRKIYSLSQRIEKNYNTFSTKKKKEEENEQNVASTLWKNVGFGSGVGAVIGAATGGLLGFMVHGVAGVVFGGVGVGGGSGIGDAGIGGGSGIGDVSIGGCSEIGVVGISGGNGIAKMYNEKEEKYHKTKESFKCLNAAALNLQHIICEIQSAEPFKTVNVCFIHHQQPSLSQILISLDKLFSALRFKGVNFRELRERAESIFGFN